MKRVSGEEDSVILAEIRKLRNEHTEAANDNKEALARLDNVFKELVERTALLEQRVVNAEERQGDTEDRTARLERSVAFLLHQETKLAAKCDDLESRSRRNNVRIHGIPEGSEKNDTIGFISGFIRSSLQIPAEVDIRIERAHRSLLAKPKENTAPPRAIIVRFLDYRVKEQVLQQAWKQKTTYEGRTIYFNQDYTNEVQKKRKQVRDVIKKLKYKNVKAQSPYPAQLNVFLASGTKIFTTLTEAAPMLRDMGIHVQEEERDELQRLRTQSSWTMVTRQKEKRSQPHTTGPDPQAVTE
ncbi:LINE-1 type transposase domain containing protein 1 [Dissostichus eleginoides]|uniref:LINE-1 type transposase domain containing protein 1 n=1 Tax=Dissostichus eleginoides TaxID=100907 RepID=A0AAD9BF35_DISEL|nr:LINE-1 type transposase domain containing protein 1 [Dissostichus eleginoides]